METAATRASPGEEKQPRKQRLSNERAIYRPPPARLILKETKEQNIDLVPVQVQNSNVKRPDVALYVPKARRLLGSEVKDDKPKVEMVIKEELPVSTRVRKTANTTSSTTANIKVAVEEVTNQNPTWKEDPKTPLAPPQVHRKISRSNSNSVPQPCELDMGDLMESCELAELSNQVSADEPRTTKVPHNTSYEEDSWEKLYSESGELLQPEALEELTMAVGSIRICQAPHEVYSPFSLEGHDEDLTHVIEVYDFPASFKTEDIFNALSTPGKPPDFSIKWVDDTHALAIYGSPYAALDALNMPHAIAKVRPLAQASKESRTCARRISTALQPFKPRPATSASLAKRMVSTALGIKNTATAEQRKKEREMLADAKARKRLAAQQKEAAWEGTISTH